MEDGKMGTRIPKRVYTAQYREAAVRQVIEAGRSAAEVARSLEMSEKTLAYWVRQVRRGQAPVKRAADLHIDEAQAELSRLLAPPCCRSRSATARSEEHTSELQSPK